MSLVAIKALLAKLGASVAIVEQTVALFTSRRKYVKLTLPNVDLGNILAKNLKKSFPRWFLSIHAPNKPQTAGRSTAGAIAHPSRVSSPSYVPMGKPNTPSIGDSASPPPPPPCQFIPYSSKPTTSSSSG